MKQPKLIHYHDSRHLLHYRFAPPMSRLKYERPDVMIGEEDPEAPYVATCLDFARPEVSPGASGRHRRGL